MRKAMIRQFIRSHILLIASCCVFLSVIVVWTVYALLAHKLIKTVYASNSVGLVNTLMASRSVTRLDEYYFAADGILLSATIWIVLVCIGSLLLLAVIKQPLGMLVTAITFLLFSFAVFAIGDLIPSMVTPLRLNVLPYFAYMQTYMPDETLAYRERPFHALKQQRSSSAYQRLNGLELPPRTFEWITDGQGFRNSQSRPFSDVVILGDSFVEWGNNEAELFGTHLGRLLNGLTVTNMGKAGYSPFQYVEVFKRYGVPKKPKYALFCFYEGNDIVETKKYLQWKNGTGEYHIVYAALSQNIFQRYWYVLSQTIQVFKSSLWMGLQMVAKRILNQNYVYPEVAILNLGAKEYKTVFVDPLPTDPPEKLLRTEEWTQLRNVLNEFKKVSEQNRIIPFIVYIPTTAHIYADYSTKKSGKYWLAVRDEQIAAKRNMENAMAALAKELKIELINLVPVYEAAAKDGTMVYDIFDTHWSLEGRQLAARAAADLLKSRYIPAEQNEIKRQTHG
jgi:hypothetical protein